MDNFYLQELILETKNRGGGMLLNFQDKPAVVVLTVDKYNQLLSQIQAVPDSPVSGKSLTVDNNSNEIKIKQKVLVTGGAGYIGGHLVRELLKQDFEVVVLDNLSTGRRDNLDSKAIFIEGDLSDSNLLRDILTNNKIEAVFHMAASLEVEESVKYPGKYFSNNVLNTVNLLNAMTEAGVKKIIFSSTAAVYGETENSPINENNSLRPNNPYGASKLLAERAIKFYAEYMGIQAVVFRYFNACGFDPDAQILPTHQSHLIFNVMQVAKGNLPHLKVFGNDYPTFDGTGIRDYVHVLDIVLPHILAFKKMDTGVKFEIYNIGSNRGLSVAQVTHSAAEILNRIIPMEISPRRPGDAAITVADNTKLKNDLGYELNFSGIENIILTSWEVMKNL